MTINKVPEVVISPRPRSTDKSPPPDNGCEAWKDRARKDKELREDVRMKDATMKNGPPIYISQN